MCVRISEPALLADLVDLLLRSGCVAHIAGETSCLVVHVDAHDAEEAWRELAFFIGAWHIAHPGVGAVLTR